MLNLCLLCEPNLTVVYLFRFDYHTKRGRKLTQKELFFSKERTKILFGRSTMMNDVEKVRVSRTVTKSQFSSAIIGTLPVGMKNNGEIQYGMHP